MIRSFCDTSQDLDLIVDKKLIASLEKWRGLVPSGNRLNGPSPTDIPLVDNRREKFGKIPKNSHKSDPVGPKQSSAGALNLRLKVLEMPLGAEAA